MDATRKTIDFLRKLTMDGFLTGEEIWVLAKFFVENHDCEKVWPGTVLSPMLESAFDDAKLTEEEMRLLAETIASIEEEWRLKNPPSAEEIFAAQPVVVAPALLPVIEARFEIPSRDEESCVVGLKEHSCTCADWQDREWLPPRHPGKCCKHVAHAFTRTGKVFEPWFQALLDDCFARGRGTNPALNWLLLQLPTKPALVGGGSGPWCNVYAPAEEGYESYAFNRNQRIWSFGATPGRAPLIERAIKENFSLEAPVSH
jgi:hypothetical protein